MFVPMLTVAAFVAWLPIAISSLHPNNPKPRRVTRTELGPSASQWTSARHHGVRDALLSAHLQSFDSPTAVAEERHSFGTPTRHTGDSPKLPG